MKADINFILEHASWPALVTDVNGVIRSANAAAITLFGAAVETGSCDLSSIWSPENTEMAERFLTRPEFVSCTVPLKFKVKGGATHGYLTSICPFTRDRQKFFVFQMPGPQVVNRAEPAPAEQALAQAREVNLAHKQKL